MYAEGRKTRTRKVPDNSFFSTVHFANKGRAYAEGHIVPRGPNPPLSTRKAHLVGPFPFSSA